MSLAFLACVEAGRLEAQTLLLCASIRRFGGRYADAPIHVFQPRKGAPLSPATLESLGQWKVVHHVEELNRDFAHYPIGNKIFVCAWAERHLANDVLVFCDSDSVVLNEPHEWTLVGGADVALRPVDHKNRGSLGPGDANDPYWLELLRLCGGSPNRWTLTTVDQQRIRAYYNSGLICTRRRAGVCAAWLENFVRIMAARHIPDGQITFMDQLTLAATISGISEHAVHVLDPRHNYPLPKRSLLPEPMRSWDLADVVHVHYHRWFAKPGFLEQIRPALNLDSEQGRFLVERLPLVPTIDDPLRFA